MSSWGRAWVWIRRELDTLQGSTASPGSLIRINPSQFIVEQNRRLFRRRSLAVRPSINTNAKSVAPERVPRFGGGFFAGDFGAAAKRKPHMLFDGRDQRQELGVRLGGGRGLGQRGRGAHG